MILKGGGGGGGLRFHIGATYRAICNIEFYTSSIRLGNYENCVSKGRLTFFALTVAYILHKAIHFNGYVEGGGLHAVPPCIRP